MDEGHPSEELKEKLLKDCDIPQTAMDEWSVVLLQLLWPSLPYRDVVFEENPKCLLMFEFYVVSILCIFCDCILCYLQDVWNN